MTTSDRPRRERLDRLLVARGLVSTRARAQALIMAGRVLSRGVRLDKPGMRIPEEIPLEIRPGALYVSRGGLKLAWALPAAGLTAHDKDAIDVGASTGGFTEVLLEAGARRVIALDVGRGQLDWGLRNDPRVFPIEGVNARYLEPATLPFVPEIAVVDVSFISMTLVLPRVMGCLREDGDLLGLVKPQFEVGRRQVGRGGIVRDAKLHGEVLGKIVDFARRSGWSLCNVLRCPVKGAEGNVEFFVHLARRGPGLDPEVSARRIATVARDEDSVS
jgi:23S rRNA (cytidine1920-2'-O)/16S rRNA (cytidine1409-2'-O)-methyltransferase